MPMKPIPSSMIGYVDLYNEKTIAGWLVDLAVPRKHLKLKILVDDAFVCETTANEYRQDLARNTAFEGSNHAFTVTLPTLLHDGKTHSVKVVESETGYVLNNSPTEVNFGMDVASDAAKKNRLDLALVGEDGWLFLCNDSNDAIGQYTGAIRFSQDQLHDYSSHYAALQKTCNTNNIYYLLTIAPGKEYIYPEFLPKNVARFPGSTVSEEFIKAVNPVLDNSILDLKPLLIPKKALGPLCYKLDSHWNYLAAKIAAEEIIRQLRNKFPQLPSLKKIGFNLVVQEETIGDLSGKVRLDYVDGSYIESSSSHPDLPQPVCAVGVEYKKQAIEMAEHPYIGLSKTRPTRLFKRTDQPDLPRAIIIRDSYADWLIPFLSECFSETLFIWARNIETPVIESFKPDVIVEEVIDRFLIKNRTGNLGLTPRNQVTINAQPSKQIMAPVLYGMSSYIPDAPFLNADELSQQTGENTGNQLFCHAISRMLNASPTSIPWGGDLTKLLTDQNRLVVPLANFLGKHIDLGDLAVTFKKINIPLVGVGLGIQGEISGVEIDSIPQGSWDWLAVLAGKSATDHPNISLRGQVTYDAIAAKGLAEKCVITGCPSNFINPSANLGRDIFRRHTNDFRRVAVIAGNPYLPDFIRLEQSLVKVVENTEGMYVCQHPRVMLKLFKQEYTNITKRDFVLSKEYIHPNLSDAEFKQWFRRWSHAFTSVPEWLSIMNGFDLVVGTRIHGVMAGIQAGVPSVCLCIDSRTLELCQTMMVPHVKASDYLDGISLEQIEAVLQQWDGRAYDDNRYMLAERFVDFFRENQLEVFGAPKELLANRKKASTL